MERPDTEIKQEKEPDIGRGILRAWGFLLLVDIVASVLGIAFLLIAHSTAMGIVGLSAHWQPAHRLVRRLVLGSPTSGTTVRLTLFGTLPFLILIGVRALMIGLGVWLLFDLGFWGQNFIWIATH